MAERNSLHRILGPPARLVCAVLPTVLGRVAVYRTFLRRELTNGPRIDIPWRRRLWLYRRGFTSETGEAYGIDEGNYRDVVSTLQHERADSITEPWDAAVNNKLLFRLLYGSFSAHLPTLYGLLDGGTLTRNSPVMTVPSWQADGSDRTGTVGQGGVARFDAVPWIDAHLAENDALVLKPVYGYGGRGVLVCRKAGSDGYDVNGQQKTTAAFAALVEGLEEYLAWDFVGNGEYVGRLYPDATGTVRVLTMWDYARDEPFVAAAVQRIGSDASRPTDNFDRGGLTAEVDETGDLGPGARWYPERGEVRWDDHHPDTGARIEGTRVPDWPGVRERVLEMAAAFPSLPRLGWDVVVTGEGEFTVLEANAHAGNRSLQVHRPLLRDPRVRRFYEHHGCL